jgi:hypothetical protein
MYSDARKLHLLDEVMKISNEATLLKIESFVKASKGSKKKKESFKDFAGTLTAEEANEMQRIIEESCETINPEDWK